ncbi:MAG: hypothetical protein WCJ54_04070 [Actinomycetota bacterium]
MSVQDVSYRRGKFLEYMQAINNVVYGNIGGKPHKRTGRMHQAFTDY